MRKTIAAALCAAAWLWAAGAAAAGALTLDDIAGGGLAAVRMAGASPLAGGEGYAALSGDGRRVESRSYETGRVTGVMFDAGNTVGESVSRIDGFIISPDGKRMLVQTATKRIYRRSFTATYYIYTIADRRLERLSDNGPQQSPVWSPDGLKVAFVRDNDIYLVKLLYGNAESRVTNDGAHGKVINGVADWVNEEEFGRSTAMAFNADGSMLCWIRYDETRVPSYQLQMFKGMCPAEEAYADYPGLYTYKYPKAGHDNAVATVMSYDIQSRRTRTLQLPVDADGYIPRVMPTGDAEKMVVYVMNRRQDRLRLYAANPRSTVCRLILEETAAQYVKQENMERIIVGDGYMVVPSDRSGHTQLYLYSLTGQLLRRLTDTRYDVTDVYGYDAATGDVYYQAAGRNAMNREVYVTAKNGKTACLAGREGWNAAAFSTDYRHFIRQWSDKDTPFEYAACDRRGRVTAVLEDNARLKAELAGRGMAAKEFFTFKTSEGVELNGVMVKPADFDPSRRYPVVMWQYGGPGSQQVVNSWNIGSMGNGALLDSYLAQRGFLVVCVDGRGTGARGAEFEKCVYMRLGNLEAKDQVETALYLASLPYVDKDNIGIWGWSYGGFNTLMSMSEGRAVFKAGVAVAPPTDWRYYDTVYTERYMRTPKENPAGYGDNPISRAGSLHGELLICQGLADDNVHPQNVFEYSEALVQAGKDFKMNVYTNRNHSIYGGNTRLHLYRQITRFFENNLKK